MRGQFNKLLIASIALRTLCFFYSIFVLLLNRPRMRRHLKFVRLLNSIIFFVCSLFLFFFFLFFFFHIWHIYIYYSLLKFLLDLYIKISLSNSNDKTSQIFICVYVCLIVLVSVFIPHFGCCFKYILSVVFGFICDSLLLNLSNNLRAL